MVLYRIHMNPLCSSDAYGHNLLEQHGHNSNSGILMLSGFLDK